MRRVIDGKAYDTETAELVESWSHDDPRSDASWSLYRTRNGAFFLVGADHSGELDEFRPYTAVESRRFLEKHANHRVEKIFGPAAEASADREDRPRFSRRTVLAAVGVLERLTQSELTRFLLELGPESSWQISTEPTAKAKRLNELIRVYDQLPDRRVATDDTLQDAIVEEAASLVRVDLSFSPDEAPVWFADQEKFRRRLAIDGYVIMEGKVRAVLPEDVGLPAAQDELRQVLDRHQFKTAVGHLEQALDAHAKGHWAAANSQIRSFLDGLLDEVAERLDPSAAVLPTGQPRRIKLAAAGFLSRGLNEWDDNGLGFVNGLVKRLHPHGSHPGLSDQDDSTFRLHVVLLTARLLLNRFDKWGLL